MLHKCMFSACSVWWWASPASTTSPRTRVSSRIWRSCRASCEFGAELLYDLILFFILIYIYTYRDLANIIYSRYIYIANMYIYIYILAYARACAYRCIIFILVTTIMMVQFIYICFFFHFLKNVQCVFVSNFDWWRKAKNPAVKHDRAYSIST